MNIYLEGFGNQIALFRLDSTECEPFVPAMLTGTHTIHIKLASQVTGNQAISQVDNCTSPDTPSVAYERGRLTWNSVPLTQVYKVLKNGQVLLETNKTETIVEVADYAEYGVIAVDAWGL